MENNEVQTLEVAPVTDDVKNQVIVTLEGDDFSRPLDFFGLTFESSDREVMDTLAPAIHEQFNVDIREYYKVTKSVNNQNIHIIPNSTAG